MRNVHEVLRQKEIELMRIRQEVDALRCVAPMLNEPQAMQPVVNPERQPGNRWPLQIDELAPVSSDE